MSNVDTGKKTTASNILTYPSYRWSPRPDGVVLFRVGEMGSSWGYDKVAYYPGDREPEIQLSPDRQRDIRKRAATGEIANRICGACFALGAVIGVVYAPKSGVEFVSPPVAMTEITQEQQNVLKTLSTAQAPVTLDLTPFSDVAQECAGRWGITPQTVQVSADAQKRLAHCLKSDLPKNEEALRALWGEFMFGAYVVGKRLVSGLLGGLLGVAFYGAFLRWPTLLFVRTQMTREAEKEVETRCSPFSPEMRAQAQAFREALEARAAAPKPS